MDSKVVKEIFIILRQNRKLGIERLYETYYAQLYAIAFSILKNHHKSQDVVQDVILRLLQMDEALFPTDGELTWLSTIIKNSALNEIKASQKCDYLRDIPIKLEAKNINETVDLEKFNEMIKDLDDERKQVLSLKILGNYKFSEIAHIMPITAKKARYLYNTSIKSIKNTMKVLGSIAITFFLIFVLNVILAIIEVVPIIFVDGSLSIGFTDIFVIYKSGERYISVGVEYTGYMFLLFTAILLFFYYNAHDLPTKAKIRKKKNEKNN
ncbi:MAG: sigma-70 family RNA polymerase sigma factor [Clostridia bacterium]|nr:sigma-70 family RNA polymerase sigma factor [Clostridia bacterium]